MNLASILEITRKNALVILLAVTAAIVIFLKSGIEKAFLLGLVIACAYFNALFLRSPFRFFRAPDAKSLTILICMLGANIALLVLLKFDPLISLLVWLPAVAGVVAANIWGRK
ncbi:hypothetical protein [Rhodoferax sp.]|uniref:hypothetical protein n=1 Tax=Rhodoferax sp. TaxID=50421 RepID=UPI003BB7D76D